MFINHSMMDKKLSSVGLVSAILLIGSLMSCTSDKTLQVPEMNFSQFEPYLQRTTDTVYVINFWATWCKPCIKEIPDFERINNDYRNEKVKVYLVSLDFPEKHEGSLIPFLKEHNIKSEVIHLTDTDTNGWIDKVSPFWTVLFLQQ